MALVNQAPARPCDRHGISTAATMLPEQHLPKSASHVKETGCPSLRIRRRGTTARLKVCRRRSDRPCSSSELRLQPYNNHYDHSPSAATDHCSISSSADSVEHPCAVDNDRVIFLNSAFFQQNDENNPKVPQQQRNNVLVPAVLKAILMMLLVILLVNFPSADGCSSRSTPKPRPPSHSAIRPNITFQTYACPPAYAAWYCLNGATCFTVKIADSILYNCECADGYMGQRCEFKDLDGTYLPARERLSMLWNPGSSLMHGSSSDNNIGQSRVGNVFLGVLLIVVATVVGAAVYTKSRSKAKRASSLQMASTLQPPPPQPETSQHTDDKSYVGQVSEKLQRSLWRLLTRRTAPLDVEGMAPPPPSYPSCPCHDDRSSRQPYMLAFHTTFHQQQASPADQPHTAAAHDDPANGVFHISSSRLPFSNMCNVALRHETGSAVKSGSINSEVDQSPRPYVVDVVDSNYPAQLTTTTTNVNSS